MSSFDFAYNKEAVKINYRIEWLHTWLDKKAIEKIERGLAEPWEVCKVKTYDVFESAITVYFQKYLSDDIYLLNMWMEIYKGNDMIYEEYLEPASTCKYLMRGCISRDMNARLTYMAARMEALETDLQNATEFIRMLGKEYTDMYDDYCRRKK